MLKNKTLDKQRVQYKTSAELEEAVQRHRKHTQKLLSDARNRRAESMQATPPAQSAGKVDDA